MSLRPMKEERSIFLAFKRLLTPLIVIGAVIIFFLSYNTYLVDHSLEDLRFALDQTAKAQNITEMERIGLLLDDALVKAVASPRIDSIGVTSLEFTKNVVSRGVVKDQLKDAEFLLNKLVKEKEEKRGGFLIAFDRMNADIQNLIRFITKELPAGAPRPEIFKSGAAIDLSVLEKAKNYEANWQLKEAISAYEEFINNHPSYSQLRIVKLRLADSYFKSQNYKEARRMYEALIKEAPQSEEAKVAEVLLAKVKGRIRKQAEEKRLGGVLSKREREGPLAKDYDELGLADAYLDKLSKDTKELVMYVMEGAGSAKRPITPGVDLTILEKAKQLEANWMFKEAQAIYEDFISKYPIYEDMVSVKILLGGVYLKSRQYQKALETYDDITKNYPESKNADLTKKLILTTKEIISISQKRQSLIDKIAKLGTTSELAQAYYNLGMVNIYIFDVENAENSFRRVMDLAPDTELAKKAEFMLGWTYKFGAKYNEGIKVLTKFVEKNKADPLAVDGAYQIADGYYKWGKFEEAAKSYEKFADNFTDSPTAQLALLQAGQTYLYNLHDPMRASESFKKMKARYPQTDVVKYSSTRLIPNTERSYRNYGFILLKQGKYEDAKEAFERAITIDSQDGWSYCGLGTALALLDSFDDGIENMTKGVQKIKDEYTYAALAFAYEKKGEYIKAIEEYKHSLLINPDYLAAYYNIGRLYIIMGWYDSAIDKFKEALRLFPNLAESHNNLGSAYWHKGEVVNAEFEFKAAIFSNPNLAEAQYNLGVLYTIAGKYSKAANHFRNALSLVPEWDAAKKHLEHVQAKIKYD